MELRLALAILMFVGASISDWQIRRVRDRYWMPFVAAAVLWLIADALTGQWSWQAIGVAAGATAFLYGLWWLGLFGGADAKGLMVVSWLVPIEPALLGGRTTPAIDGLLNGALLVVAVPVLFLILNLARGHLQLPAMLLGLKMAKDKARAGHNWPLQTTTGWQWFHKPGVPVHWHKLPDPLWVTPKLPFMLPLTAGLIAAWKGNMLLLLMLS